MKSNIRSSTWHFSSHTDQFTVNIIDTQILLIFNLTDIPIKFCQLLRNFDVIPDNTLSLYHHVMSKCKAAYTQLRWVSTIYNVLSVICTKTYVYLCCKDLITANLFHPIPSQCMLQKLHADSCLVYLGALELNLILLYSMCLLSVHYRNKLVHIFWYSYL